MRVLFWASTFFPLIGGVQTLARTLLPALENRGCRHLVVTSQTGWDEPTVTHYESIPVHRFSFSSALNNIDQLAQVKRQIAELKRSFAPDLIHIFAVNPSNFFHHVTSDAHPAPLLVSLHGDWRPPFQRTLRQANWIVSCSQALLEIGETMVPGILPRSTVIYNGREEPMFQPQRLPTDSPRLLCLGRLSPEKGFDIALAAFAKIHASFPEAKMIIAGDGPSKEHLQRQIIESELAGRVEVLGWVAQEEVFALLNNATLVLVPSRREGLSLIAVEAALMARPVVGTKVGGLPEVVVHAETGLLVQEENSDALARAIAFLLDHPDTAIAMGQAGQRRAKQKFSMDRYIDAYDTIYRNLISKTKLSSVEA